jgi:hypothetical protein
MAQLHATLDLLQSCVAAGGAASADAGLLAAARMQARAAARNVDALQLDGDVQKSPQAATHPALAAVSKVRAWCCPYKRWPRVAALYGSEVMIMR